MLSNTVKKNITQSCILAISIVASVISYSPANAGTDRKIMPSTFCEGTTKIGREFLVHNGSSLHANGADVTVVCPILRGSTLDGLREFRITFKKSSAQDSRRISVKFYSCNGNEGGGCATITKRTNVNSFEFTSAAPTISELSDFPQGDKHYYFLKTILPNDWKIVFIRYTEED